MWRAVIGGSWILALGLGGPSAAAPAARAGGALEYRPGDTGIYEDGRAGGRQVKYRISARAQTTGRMARRHAAAMAVKSWEQAAAAEFGVQFADWRSAQGKAMNCGLLARRVAFCTASAIPSL